MTENEKLNAEVAALKRQVLMERIQRLLAEKQSCETTMVIVQMRLPMVEQELAAARAELKENHGTPGH